MWAGNSGTPTGGDHCGNTPSGTTLPTYQQSFSYDSLDRMASGPAGSVTYGDINHVHAATTLSSMPNPYAGYDAMGNMTCRNTDTTSGHTCGSSPTGALMSYDNEGRLASWTAPSGTTATDGFLYDNEGNRVLQETSTSSITDTITFDSYTETVITGGTPITTKYYSANSQRVAMRTSSTLSYLLADALGSSTVALDSTGATQAIQLFAPYGSIRYSQGSMPTTYNFTGQRLDSQTGLLYYNFRYYDPLSGRFTRADTTQTNAGGMDPYAYVGDNPETKDDPTGHDGWTQAWNVVTSVLNTANTVNKAIINVELQVLDFVTGASSMVNDVKTIFNGKANLGSKLLAGADLAFNVVTDVLMLTGVGEELRGGELALKAGGELLRGGDELLRGGEELLHAGEDTLHGGEDVLHGECGPLSFTPGTAVTTDHGKQAIGTLQVGERVLAYNPRTHKMEQKPILHVWINHDHDLVDLTITTTTKGPDGKVAKTSEVIHTNQKHPFFTMEHGFLPVGQITLGMHLLRADGRVGVITGWKVVPGTQVMYNLEVAQDHTFTVGDGQWVVHNRCSSTRLRDRMGLGPNRTLPFPVQAAHLIPCQLSSTGSTPHPLVTLAEGGPSSDFLDQAWNGFPLPIMPADSNTTGRPFHNTNHSAYTNQVRTILDAIYDADPGMTQADAQLTLKQVAAILRRTIFQEGALYRGAGGCSINDISLF